VAQPLAAQPVRCYESALRVSATTARPLSLRLLQWRAPSARCAGSVASQGWAEILRERLA